MTKTSTTARSGNSGTAAFGHGRPGRFRWGFWLGVPAASILMAAGIYLGDQHWPYRHRKVQPMLEQVFASRITVSAYHRIYFPHPSFVAKGLTLRRSSAPDVAPIGSTQDLIVEGRWADLLLFRRRVRLVDVKGLHIVIPPVGSRANQEDFPTGSSLDFVGLAMPAGGQAKFLERLRVDGGFVLPQERATNRAKEKALTGFSERAQRLRNGREANGDPAGDVLSSLEGPVTIRHGVVSSQRLTFEVPGAEAELNGGYNLGNGKVHLIGNLKMDSDISHVTTGFKSLLLKPLVPFFRKDNAGALVPIVVTGAPDNYEVKRNLLHRK